MSENSATRELTFEEIDIALIEAADRLGHDIDDDKTLDALHAQYAAWKEYGIFVSEGGLFINRLDQEEPPPHLTIPEEFGYKTGGVNYAIHFLPPYFSKDESGEVVRNDADHSLDDQKNLAILNGLMGCLEYIFLVEADLLPKPENIVGVTNPTMAKFAQRAGLKTVSQLAGMVSSLENVESVDDDLLAEMLNTTNYNFFHGELSEEDIRRALPMLVLLAANAKKAGEARTYSRAVWLANRLMLNDKSQSSTTLVWGTYEEFRDGVIEFNEKFGHRIIKLAERDLSKVGA